MNRDGRQMRAVSTAFETKERGGEKWLDAYFAVFDSVYEIAPGLSESIEKGAFDDALDDDVRALIDHDTRLVLGRNKAGTLALQIDGHGLFGSILINQNDQDAVNVYERVKRGDVDQCSFGFDILDEDYQAKADGSIHWTIKKVKLYEVSVCTFPAYEETSVTARKRQAEGIKERSLKGWRIQMNNKLKGEKRNGVKSVDA